MISAHNNKQYITITELEEILKVSRLIIKSWINQKKFPKPRKMSHRAMWDIEVVRDWLKRNDEIS